MQLKKWSMCTATLLIIALLICACKSNSNGIKAVDRVEDGSLSKVENLSPSSPIKEVKVGEDLKLNVLFKKGEVWIQKINVSSKCKKLVIPNTIEGVPVTRIEYDSNGKKYDELEKATNIFGVEMGGEDDDEASTVDDMAPANNKNIREIVLPDTIDYIAENSFSGLTKLKKINIPTKLKHIRKYLFSRCKTLKRIDIPENVDKIDLSAFCWCDGLLEIHVDKRNPIFRENGAIIENRDTGTMICIAKKVKKLYIGKSIKKIGRLSLDNLAPKTIIVKKSNPYLKSKSNCIYTKRKSKLIAALVDNKKAIHIPREVKILGNRIEWGGEVNKLFIPDSIKKCFQGWTSGLYSSKCKLYVYIDGTRPFVGINGKADFDFPVFSYIRMGKKLAQRYNKVLKKQMGYKLVWKSKKNAYRCEYYIVRK
ncbi:MAG: leucine-rich repeat domain-containing protein [Eubacterium sp.]|nr:leucine-rich repeat domain-containing protein [Eubacterium sp.]